MTATAKTALVEALRSSRYGRASGAWLRTPATEGVDRPDNFTLWGVLCDISGLGGWRLRRGVWAYVIDGIENVDTGLPSEVRQWAGIHYRIEDRSEFSGSAPVVFEIPADLAQGGPRYMGWESLNNYGWAQTALADIIDRNVEPAEANA